MKLWGGAVEADIPLDLLDASDFRPVPDEQEVFVGLIRGIRVSLIIDLLERVEASSLMDALSIHSAEAHRLAGAKSPKEPLQTFTAQDGPYDVAGRVDSANDSALEVVYTLFRLTEFKTDVVVTFTADFSENRDAQNRQDLIAVGLECVHEFIKTFVVVDKKLFVKEAEAAESHQAQAH